MSDEYTPPMADPARELFVTVEEYLEGEQVSPVKHEYVDGRVFAMGGASLAHTRIIRNLVVLLDRASRGGPCEVLQQDMKVHPDEGSYYYPDLTATCVEQRDPYVVTAPCLVVEVLSPSTEAVDRGEKLQRYRRLPSLEAYVLVSQDRAHVEVYRRGIGGVWTYEELFEDEALALPCLGVSLDVGAIYDRVELSPQVRPSPTEPA